MSDEMFPKKRLGFGLMRLPSANGKIDLAQVSRMADRFLEQDFTYFDTAFVYAGSEEAFREAVVKRHSRDRYTIATKMASWELSEDFGPKQMFQKQLDRCGVEYFDFYLLHSIQPMHLPRYNEYRCWEFCQRMKAAGKIKWFGFSFHGGPELLEQVLTEHPEVDFVQLQINYLDWNSGIVCSEKNYEVCRRYNKPIVVMEPVKGGMLANLKPEFSAQYHMLDEYASPASYALRFAASLPGVMAVLSGMSDMEQMEDNLHTFNELKLLTEQEQGTIEKVKAGILSIPTIGCTACRYCCSGCPKNINIPEIFKSVNEILSLGDHVRPHLYYEGMLASGQTAKASACIGCGQCEQVCPQHIKVIKCLKQASEMLDYKN